VLADLVNLHDVGVRQAGDGLALEEAERRLPEGGGDGLRARFDACRADLDLLRDLDAIDRFRWTPIGYRYPEEKVVAVRWQAALERFGVWPGESPDEAARRVAGSAVRDRLVAALDRCLRAGPSGELRSLLRAVDPDAFRDAVRDAVMAGDGGRVAELAARAAALDQPPGFAAALGEDGRVPVVRRRGLLVAALARWPGDLGLLMALGGSYPIYQREGAEERLLWYQATVAAHPGNPAAHYNLANALRDKGDVDGALVQYQETIRLEPRDSRAYLNLGVLLQRKGDADGAVAAYQEARRLNPRDARARNNLGSALHDRGDLDGAIAYYREALDLDPDLGIARDNLKQAERWRQLLPRVPEVASGRVDPATPVEMCEFADLYAQRWQKRFTLAVRLDQQAFALDPKLADDLAVSFRSNAACYAALAAAGKDADRPTPGAGERQRLRDLAREWLRADLALWADRAKDPKNRPLVRQTLIRWTQDPNLITVRDPAALAALPPAERQAWQAFWADVDALLAAVTPLP
jgi:Flp pilus assembly protein TadD